MKKVTRKISNKEKRLIVEQQNVCDVFENYYVNQSITPIEVRELLDNIFHNVGKIYIEDHNKKKGLKYFFTKVKNIFIYLTKK